MNNVLRVFTTLVPFTCIWGCMDPSGLASITNKNFRSEKTTAVVDLADDFKSDLLLAENSSLYDVIEKAVVSHPEVKSAQFAEKKSAQMISSVSSEKLMKVIGNVNAGGIRKDDADTTLTAGVSGELNIAKVVFDGGVIDNLVSKQTLEYESAKENTRSVKNEIGRKAGTAWVHFSSATQKLQAIDDVEKLLLPYAENAKKMTETGLLDRTMSDKIETILLELDLEKQTALHAVEIATLNFSNFFGTPPNSITFPKKYFQKSDFEKFLQEIGESPTLKKADLKIAIANAVSSEKRAAFSPKINLQAGVSSPLDPSDTAAAQAGFRVNYIFNDGGKRQADLEAAEESVRQAIEDKESAMLAIESATQSDVRMLKLLEASIVLGSRKRQMLIESLEVLRSQLKTGQANFKQLADLQIAHHRISVDILDKEAELMTTRYKLAATLGMFDLIAAN